MKERKLNRVLKGCRNNIRADQETLYRFYFPKAQHLVRRFTQDEDFIITIINDSFLKVFKQIDKYEGKGSFEGWMRRIVYHSVSDFFRKQNRYTKNMHLVEHDVLFEPNQGVESLYVLDIMELVNDLPDITKTVFSMFTIEGYSHQEISAALHVPIGTSKWHLFEARKKLKLAYLKNNRSYKYAE